jgi:hypothetical protein
MTFHLLIIEAVFLHKDRFQCFVQKRQDNAGMSNTAPALNRAQRSTDCESRNAHRCTNIAWRRRTLAHSRRADNEHRIAAMAHDSIGYAA